MHRNFILLALLALACPYAGALEPEVKVPKNTDAISVDPATSRALPVKAGRIFEEPPTLECLGFRWYIEGDANRNAVVTAHYREKGGAAWSEAYPPLRVHHEVVDQDRDPYRAGNLFAGSVLFLRPDTEYEVQLEMHDPDGGDVPARTLTMKTRAVPALPPKLREIHLHPSGHPEARQDWQETLKKAEPGDAFLFHAGVYATDGIVLAVAGSAEHPLVLKNAGDGEAVITGTAKAAKSKQGLINASGTRHLWVEGLAFRKTNITINGGEKGGPGAVGLVVRRCRIEDVVEGIRTGSENASGWYIADNIVLGRNENWYPRIHKKYMQPSSNGIDLCGRGHVVTHNQVRNFGDLISIYDFHGCPAEPELQCAAIDICYNDIAYAKDDLIETDYHSHNVRVYCNRGFNGETGVSVQPNYGGPVYIVRNVLYGLSNISLKLHLQSTGTIAAHNTFCIATAGFRSASKWQNGHIFNNLFMGGNPKSLETKWRAFKERGGKPETSGAEEPPPAEEKAGEAADAAEGGEKGDVEQGRKSARRAATGEPAAVPVQAGKAGGKKESSAAKKEELSEQEKELKKLEAELPFAMRTGTPTPYSELDYNGYSAVGPFFARWIIGKAHDYTTLAEFSKATGYERHGAMLDYKIFVQAVAPEEGQTYKAGDADLRLVEGAAAVDAGLPLVNLSGETRGKAPDLGCYEFGAAVPQYGPRQE